MTEELKQYKPVEDLSNIEQMSEYKVISNLIVKGFKEIKFKECYTMFKFLISLIENLVKFSHFRINNIVFFVEKKCSRVLRIRGLKVYLILELIK